MTTDANLLIVSNGSVPERIRAGLEEQGALVEAISTSELAISFQVVGPDLVVHFGLAGARETAAFLRKERDARVVRLVLVGPRAELGQMRKLDREIVLGVLADDMSERVICERILSLSNRKQEPHRVLSVPSAKVPSVSPDVLDPHLQRPLPHPLHPPAPQSPLAATLPALPPQPLPPPGFERERVFGMPTAPPSSEETILTWLKSTPPPRISERAYTDELSAEEFWDESAPVLAPIDDERELLPSFGDEAVRTPLLPEALSGLPSDGEALSEGSTLSDAAQALADAAIEEEVDDRDTLMMDIDPSLIESEVAAADRETVHTVAGPPFDSPDPSVASVVTDTRVVPDTRAEAGTRLGDRARVRWTLVAVVPLGLALLTFSLRRSPAPPVREKAESSVASARSDETALPLPQEKAPELRVAPVPADAAAPTEINPWVRPENIDIPACDAVIGDKKELRLGDVDQSALIWKRARGRLVLGDRKGALVELCRAAYIFPSGLAVEALIEQLLEMDAPRKAEPFMVLALKARPHRPKTLELQGDLVSQLGDQEEARKLWLVALGVPDNTPKVIRQVARQIVAQAESVLSGGQVGLAERLFRRAAGLDPAHSNALLGLSRIAEGRSDMARANAFRALAEKARQANQ